MRIFKLSRIGVGHAGGSSRDEESTMKPWEQTDLADLSQMEARLAYAKELRREELGPWLAEAWHAVVEAIASALPHRHAGSHHHAA